MNISVQEESKAPSEDEIPKESTSHLSQRVEVNYTGATSMGEILDGPSDIDVVADMGEIDYSNSDVRGISINPLSSGYMVKVGCQSIAIETTATLIDMLNKYLTNPSDFEKKWYSKNTRNRLENI